MTKRDVWIYLSSVDSFIGAYDSDEVALDAALERNDPQPWVELAEVGE